MEFVDTLLSDEDARRPAFDLLMGGKRVGTVNDRLIALTLTDNRGFEADTLEMVLDDADDGIDLPARGVQISVSLGWEGEALVHKGLFTVDEVSHSGPPDQLTVTARSADFREEFNLKREYSWHDVTVGDVVSAIAGRYRLQPGVSRSLKDVEIDHADQTQESDISFLTRMAELLGAIATIKNGMLLFMVPGQGTTQSGKPLPAISLTRESGDRHSFRVADRDAYTGVRAYWLDLNVGKKVETTLTRKRRPGKKKYVSSRREGDYLEGAEGNVYVMRQTFKTEKAARRAAAAKWSTLQRGAAEFGITLARGRPDIYPELPARVSGFKPAIDNAGWVIARVVHTLGERGYVTALELEVSLRDAEMALADSA